MGRFRLTGAACLIGLAAIPLPCSGAPAARRGLETMVHGAQIERWPEGAMPSGTGFLVGSGGRVLANAHTVAGCRRIHLLVPGSGEHEATVIGIDARLDVALLEVRGLSGTPLPPSTGAVAAGTRVEVLVLADAPDGRAQIGRIPGRVLKGTAGTGNDGLIEIASDLRPGQSGSPVVSDGSLIGFVIGRKGADAGRGVVQPTSAFAGFLRYFAVRDGAAKRPDALRLASRDLPIFQVNCS